MRPSPITKPDPSCNLLQAGPSTFTADRATRAATSKERPVDSGGAPRFGVGRRASKTSGNEPSPTTVRSACIASGAGGSEFSTVRAIHEFEVCVANHPGLAMNTGITSQRMMTTPTSPATPPSTRSTAPKAPSRRRGVRRPPTMKPMACPSVAPTSSRPMESTSRSP